MPKKEHKPLSEAQLKLCPYGDPKCRLCKLPPKDIEELHRKRFVEKLTYAKLRVYVKERYGIGEDYTRLSNHFNKHVMGKDLIDKVLAQRSRKVKYPEVTAIIKTINDDVKIRTTGELEKAYESLVKMAKVFTERVRKLQDTIEIDLAQRDVREEIKLTSALDLMEKQAKLVKEAREFVKDIGSLRAPKVMVAHFLESFIDTVIKEMSVIIGNIAAELKYSINGELAEAGYEDIVSEATYAKIFKKIAEDYRDKMIAVKKHQMSDALSTLQDLEKII